MRKRTVLLVALALAAVSIHASLPAHAEGNVNFILGQKSLDDDGWGRLDEHAEIGVLVTFGEEDWPVHIAIDFIATADTITTVPIGSRLDIEAFTSELGVGVRKIWKKDNLRPFVGGGVAMIGGELDFIDTRGVSFGEDDQALGLWVDGGVFWRLGKKFNIGFDVRISRAEIELRPFGDRVDVKAGGDHIGLLLGWGW
ncbi:MAG: hypothetical protein JSV80_00075 [Acidobacteriota bacterium]|nr:MAG: hypothetical protein JSV80_00075 [Acidobacteriota bacterium]